MGDVSVRRWQQRLPPRNIPLLAVVERVGMGEVEGVGEVQMQPLH